MNEADQINVPELKLATSFCNITLQRPPSLTEQMLALVDGLQVPNKFQYKHVDIHHGKTKISII